MGGDSDDSVSRERIPESAAPSETVVLIKQPKPYLQVHLSDPEQIWVEVVGGPMDGLRRMVSGEALSIGRGDQNSLVLSLDMMVSAEHARVSREESQFWLEDLESRNGTFLGDDRVRGRAPIRPGTIFSVGGTCLEFMPR